MSNVINELIPGMTKQRALDLLLEYVSVNGKPVKDIIVLTEERQGSIESWTYKGLKAFIMIS